MGYTLGLFAGWLFFAFVVGLLVLNLPDIVARVVGRRIVGIDLAQFALMVAMPFVYIWILTGQAYYWILTGQAYYAPAAALVIGLVSVRLLVGTVARTAFGADGVERNARAALLVGSVEPKIGRARIFAGISVNVLGLLTIGLMSYFYFTREARSAGEAMLALVLYAGPVSTLLIGNVLYFVYLSMPSMDETMRTTSLLEAAFALVPVTLQAIIAAYTLHGDMISSGVSILGYEVSFYLSASLLGFLCFLGLAVGPYVAGVSLARKMRLRLLLANERLTSQSLDAIFRAYWPCDGAGLAKAAARASEAGTRLAKQHPAIERFEGLHEVVRSDGADAPSWARLEELQDYRWRDVRLRVHDRITFQAKSLQYAAGVVDGKHADTVKRQVLDHMALELMHRLRLISEEVARVSKSQPALFATVAIVTSFIGSAALSLVGKVLFELIVRSVHL